jgi:hypothetical protein
VGLIDGRNAINVIKLWLINAINANNTWLVNVRKLLD